LDPDPNDTILDDITNLVVGDLLYKAISTISEGQSIEGIQRRMEGVSVFLDTGIIFRVLGYFGRIHHKAGLELLDICKATGCALKAFEHSVDEVTEGLLSVASRLHAGSNAYGPIVAFAVEQGYSAADLVEASQRVASELADLAVEVVSAPPIEESTSINEVQLEWQIETDVKQNNPTARARDVKSLAGIYRFRDGKARESLESCVQFLLPPIALWHYEHEIFSKSVPRGWNTQRCANLHD
jgi:hypothetical protein